MPDGAANTRELAADFRAFIRRAAAALLLCPLPVAREVARALQTAAETKTLRGEKAGGAPRHIAATKTVRGELDNFCAVSLAEGNSPDNLLLKTAAALAKNLPWRAAGNGKIKNLAAAELVGPDGLAKCETCRAGLIFQPAGIFYSWHRHNAEEIYLIAGGEATWHAAGKSPQTAGAGGFMHHASRRPHAMQTFGSPLLAFWGWHGDIGRESYELCAAPKTNSSCSSPPRK